MNKLIGVIGFIISIFLIIFSSTIVLKLTNFVETFVSQDHHITQEGVQRINFFLIILILLILIFSISFFFNLFRKLIHYSANFIDWVELKKFFLTDDICSKKQLPVYLLVISSIYGLLVHSFLIFYGEPEGKGNIETSRETISSSLFLISALVLILSRTQINKNQFSPKIKKQIVLFLFVFSGISFFVFGEEISWGQRIFNWESFGIFNEYNYQSETNSHNFFNPLFKFIYPFVGLSSFIGLFFIWIFPKNKSYIFQLIIPPPSLFFIVFLMACSSFRGHSEIYEELLAMFLLLYSIRIFICLRFRNNKFS